MNKKLVVILLLVIIFIALVGFIIFKMVSTPEKKSTPEKQIETVDSDNGFIAYSLSNITVSDPKANLIFIDELGEEGQQEFKTNLGYLYNFNKYGEHTIKVLELTEDYITLSLSKGLAPTKDVGGFSMTESYDKVTIKKNTGICLNVQKEDLKDGYIHIFYVNK